MDQFGGDLQNHLAEQYQSALIMSQNGKEAQALGILLQILYDPRLPHYRRGLVHFVLGGMNLPKSFGDNLFYAKNHLLRAIDAFEYELAGGNNQLKHRVKAVLIHARAVTVEPFQKELINWKLLDTTNWKHNTTGQRQVALGPQKFSNNSRHSTAHAHQEDYRATLPETFEPGSEQVGGFAQSPNNRRAGLKKRRVCENCGVTESSGAWAKTKQGGFNCSACYQYQWRNGRARGVFKLHGIREGHRRGVRVGSRGGSLGGSSQG